MRSARDVFEDHLRLATQGHVDDDLERNYAPDALVLSSRGVYRGHAELRKLADLLQKELPKASFYYKARLVEDDLAFLEWTATAEGARVDDGADSFVIRDGKIIAQTIHYTVKPT